MGGLQYFCGYPGYDDEKLPFDSSLMVYFRKRLTPEVLGEINEMIVRDAKERQAKEAKSKEDDDDSDNHPGTGGNSGTMIVDATCAPSNIRYPQDVSLLNEARENAEKLLDALHDSADGKKPRTYRHRARKDYLKYTRCRKHTVKMTRKAIGKQLAYLRRDLDAVDGKLSLGKSLTTRQMERLDTIRTIYEQQKYMYDNHTHSVPDRIVSVSQPFVRPIVRGKAGKPVEFGAKLDISVVDGWTRLECCSFDAYNEAGNLKEMAERFREREGHYPSRILADKIYRNRENLSYCKEHGIRLSGPALGRPKKAETRDKAQDYRDKCERVEVERRFSLAKRKPKGLAPKTVRNIHQMIGSAYNLAMEQKLVSKNPTQGCALPKVEHKEMKTLTANQLSAFFQEARDSGVYELYYLDLATGLRRGELLGLKWTDIDLDRGVLKIQRAISRQNGKVVEAPLKTKNAYRTLPLSADAISVLKMQKCKVGNSEWVFPSPSGGPMSPDSVLHMLQRVLKRAGLPRIRFHDLRHTFATMALQNGVDVKTVSSMLGHYSAGFTLDTYAHVTTDAQLKAAQTMGNILSRAI